MSCTCQLVGTRWRTHRLRRTFGASAMRARACLLRTRPADAELPRRWRSTVARTTKDVVRVTGRLITTMSGRDVVGTPISFGFLYRRPAVEVFHGLVGPDDRDHEVCTNLDILAVAVLPGCRCGLCDCARLLAQFFVRTRALKSFVFLHTKHIRLCCSYRILLHMCVLHPLLYMRFLHIQVTV